MGWARIDDDFPNHPKVWRVGPDGVALFLEGLCHAAKFLTDGLLPREDVERMRLVKRPLVSAAKLVEVGLWEAEGDNFRIHDYHDYNPTSQEVRDRRASTRTRVEQHRKRASNAVTSLVTDGVTNTPSPRACAGAHDGPGKVPSSGIELGGESERGLVLSPGQLRAGVSSLVSLWNDRAVEPFIRVSDNLAPASVARAEAALKAHSDLAWWLTRIVEVTTSTWCAGGGPSGWVADFWWMLDHADEIASGRYRNHQKATSRPRDISSAGQGWRERCRQRGHEPSCQTLNLCDLLHEKSQRGAA
jgi:hypothetical protein